MQLVGDLEVSSHSSQCSLQQADLSILDFGSQINSDASENPLGAGEGGLRQIWVRSDLSSAAACVTLRGSLSSVSLRLPTA